MESTVQIIIWWTGAVLILALLAAATLALGLALKHLCIGSWHSALRTAQLSTVRYWVDRTEREGLTVCRKEYRRMVAKRKPKTADEYNAVEYEANEAAHGIKGDAA